MVKFRFTKQKAFFTYKTWLPKDKVKEFFWNLKPTKNCIIAHETGDETNTYPHTHIYVEWGEPYDTKNERTFDWQTDDGVIHPHIKGVGKKKEDFASLMRYLAKEDKENAHLLEMYPLQAPSIAMQVWKCETKQEVALLAKRPNDVVGLLALWEAKARSLTTPLNPQEHLHHRWQNTLWREVLEIEKKWDKRALRWIIGAKGNEGKSLFIKVLVSNFRQDVLVATQFAGQSNIANVMQNAMMKGWTGKILAVDLPRDAINHQIYEPLEAIMNGTITATKYQGDELTLNERPIVLVMSNFEPNEERMSKDRWWISDIHEFQEFYENKTNLILSDRLNEEREKRLRQEEASKFYRNAFDWGNPKRKLEETPLPGSATNNITNVALPSILPSNIYIEPEPKKQKLEYPELFRDDGYYSDEELAQMIEEAEEP